MSRTWRSWASRPTDSREFLSLHLAHGFAGIDVIRRTELGAKHPYLSRRGHPVCEAYASGYGTAMWAELDAVPGPLGSVPDGWEPMNSAPTDGTPFWRLAWVHNVCSHLGRPNYHTPELDMLYRDGCWMSEATSIPDLTAARGYWTRVAIPFSPDHQLAEVLREAQERRDRRAAIAEADA